MQIWKPTKRLAGTFVFGWFCVQLGRDRGYYEYRQALLDHDNELQDKMDDKGRKYREFADATLDVKMAFKNSVSGVSDLGKSVLHVSKKREEIESLKQMFDLKHPDEDKETPS